MTTCFIHIGTHKTGSSSIHEMLSSNNCGKAIYPVFEGHRTQNYPLIALFRSEKGIEEHQQWLRNLGKNTEYDSVQLENELSEALRSASSQDRPLLLSAEILYHEFTKEDLQRLNSKIEYYFNKIQIVGYIRPAGSLIGSTFQQAIRTGGLSEFDLEGCYVPYRENIIKFDKVFSCKNVDLVPFEKSRFPDSDVVYDFCDRIGLPRPTSRVHANHGISATATALIYFLNRNRDQDQALAKTTRLARHWIVSKYGSTGSRMRLAPETISPILEKYSEDIGWIQQRLGLVLYDRHTTCDVVVVGGEKDLLDLARQAVASLQSEADAGKVPDNCMDDISKLIERLQ